jgi:hypothetical protein
LFQEVNGCHHLFVGDCFVEEPFQIPSCCTNTIIQGVRPLVDNGICSHLSKIPPLTKNDHPRKKFRTICVFYQQPEMLAPKESASTEAHISGSVLFGIVVGFAWCAPHPKQVKGKFSYTDCGHGQGQPMPVVAVQSFAVRMCVGGRTKMKKTVVG